MIYDVEIFEYENCPHFRSTNDALLVTSISIALQNVGACVLAFIYNTWLAKILT